MIKKIFLLSFCLLGLPSPCLAYVPQVYKKSEVCPADKPFKPLHLQSCEGCDTFHSMKIAEGHEADFEICEEREIVDGYSRLKQCPQNFVRDMYGNCIPCDWIYFVPVTQEADCQVCPNREVGYKWTHDVQEVFRCQWKTCPEDRPVLAGGTCFACDADVFSDNPKEACEKCPDRMFLPKGYTIFQNDETRVYAGKDICIQNVEDGLVDLTRQIVVENIDGRLRAIGVDDDLSMMLAKSLPEFDESEWQGRYEDKFRYLIHEADTDADVVTLPEICSKWPNREFKDGYCILNSCPDGMIRVATRYGYPTSTTSRGGGLTYHRLRSATEYRVQEQCEFCHDLWEDALTTRENCYKCPDTFFEELVGRAQLLGHCRQCYVTEKNEKYAAQAFAQGRCLDWKDRLKEKASFKEKKVVPNDSVEITE